MRRIVFGLCAVLAPSAALRAQTPAKPPLTHEVYNQWKSIRGERLANDGRWLAYAVDPASDDGTLHVRNLESPAQYAIPRGSGPAFSSDSRFVVFLIEPISDSIQAAKRAKRKPDRQPKDSLGILNLATGEVARVPRVASFALPDGNGQWLAYLLEKAPPADSTGGEGGKPRGEAAAGGEGARQEASRDEKQKEEGTTLVLRRLATGEETRFEHVTEYALAEPGNLLAYAVSTADGAGDGVFVVSLERDAAQRSVAAGGGVYKGLVLDRAGAQVAFLSDRDDRESDEPAFALYHWRAGRDSARLLAGAGVAGVPAGWEVSEHGDLSFSHAGRRLFFGTAPRRESAPQDTTTPDDERVKLDVWHWRDPYLQPMQLEQAEEERKRSYRAVAHLDNGRIVQLGTDSVPTVEVGGRGDAGVAIGSSDLRYRRLLSWDSPSYDDYYLVDVTTGARRRFLERTQAARMSLSAVARYAVWWSYGERAWLAMDVESGTTTNLTAGVGRAVHEEDDDRPMPPPPYGLAGWTAGDRRVLVYDRFDVWSLDPAGRAAPVNVTRGDGRAAGMRFRYVRLDREEQAIDPARPLLLSAFDERTKAAGFYRVRLAGDGRPERLLFSEHAYSTPRKADDADVLLLTRESFQEFPDLWVGGLTLADLRRMSDANPQQAEYRWGAAELVEWRSAGGAMLQGLLFKPEGFDPARRYPMIVNFYERSSDGLYRHRAPEAHRSTINYTFYTSRGYLVFTPDVVYRVGYPGESAVQSVVPGVLHLIRQGFVDPERICLQGHSWGGYQIAFMVTKTDMFRCAAPGAPVANMTSAYGGIRWGSGMSRMFQYERTQSRIGASLWEAPMRYLENSPLFWADKIATPLLIMHNDEDTAVPWEQGIELFVALRRLGKPAWLINYNGQPHWPTTEANRKDWQKRLQQFFDHYLLDAPPPVWLAEGVPALLKGTTLGLELVEEGPKATGGNGN